MREWDGYRAKQHAKQLLHDAITKRDPSVLKSDNARDKEFMDAVFAEYQENFGCLPVRLSETGEAQVNNHICERVL